MREARHWLPAAAQPHRVKPSIEATLVRAFVAWWLILGLAIVNGALREAALVPAFGAAAGLMASGVVLSACVFAVAALLVARLGPVSMRMHLGIGAFWFVLTLAFEFGFGRVVAGKTWAQLLDAYTLRGGNLWPLVLVVVVFAPLVAAWLRQRRRK